MTEPTHPTMTAPEFQAVCALLWGDGWRPQAAQALGVGMRNVQFWAAEPPARSKPVPAGIAGDLVGMVARRMADPIEVDRMRAEARRAEAKARILLLLTALESPRNDSRG